MGTNGIDSRSFDKDSWPWSLALGHFDESNAKEGIFPQELVTKEALTCVTMKSSLSLSLPVALEETIATSGHGDDHNTKKG